MKSRVLRIAASAILVTISLAGFQAKALNPYLPLDQYVPDGEPRVFTYNGETRAYIYGSYDMDGYGYCSDCYHVFSAPVDDLNNWTDHGISFAVTDRWESEGVPDGCTGPDWEGSSALYAPDCIQGADGRFYLYFCTSDGKEGVAVSDTPWGPFEDAKRIVFDGSAPEVKSEGTPAEQIDPAVFIDDDGKIYYYWGQFSMQAAELNDDMCTIKTDTYTNALITSDKPFEFHEGSSMRKINGKYYLIYCSTSSGGANTLDYAIGDSPLGPFEYQGTICNNADLDPASWNAHGSVAEINGEYYVFYHASTENTVRNRRARVEKIKINSDGTIDQVENTSLGFQDYLDPYTEMLAPYGCQLGGGCYFGDETDGNGDRIFPMVRVTDGCFVGYKYFEFGSDNDETIMEVRVRPQSGGVLEVHSGSPDGELLGTVGIPTGDGKEWVTCYGALEPVNGRHAIYLVFRSTERGAQVADLLSFRFRQTFDHRIVSVAGSNAANSGAGFYEAGDTVELDAGQRTGYRFCGWTASNSAVVFADAGARQTSFIMPDEHVTVTANWEPYRAEMIYLDGKPLFGFDPEQTKYQAELRDMIPEVTADVPTENGLPIVKIIQAGADNQYRARVQLLSQEGPIQIDDRLEAENMEYAAGADKPAGDACVEQDPAASGGARVDRTNGVGAYIRFSLYGNAGGEADLTFHYASNENDPSYSLFVNGIFVQRLQFKNSGGWTLSTPADLQVHITGLQEGINTIEIRKADETDTPLKGINLDYVDVSYEIQDRVEKEYTVQFVRTPQSFDFTNTTKEELLKSWTITHEDTDHWSLGEDGLTITTQRGDIHQAGNSYHNLFTQEAAGDWVMETAVKFDSVPSQNYQQASIMAFEGENDYLKLSYESTNGTSVVQLGWEENGKFTVGNRHQIDTDMLYYRLEKVGHVFTASFSVDGSNWIELGSHEMELQTPRLAMLAINGETDAAPLNVHFRYMHIQQIYRVAFDSNGGSGEMAAVAVKSGSTYTLPECTFAAPSGKQFKAWSVNGEEKPAGTEITVSADVTITAVWEDIASVSHTSVSIINSNTKVDGRGVFNLNLEDADGIALVEVTFTSSDADMVIQGLNGFQYLDTNTVTLADGTVQRTATFCYLPDGQGGVNFSCEEPVTIATIAVSGKQSEIAIDKVAVGGYDGAGEPQYGTASITVDGAEFLVYDIHGDGVVNLLDILAAQKHYQADESQANWAEASRSDVNDDKVVDLRDLVEILINYTEKA